MMPATDEGQVGQDRLPPTRPPDEVVAIAPVRRPVTAVEDAVPIARDEGAAGGGRDLPVGVAGGLALQLALPQKPGHRRIARVSLRRFHRYRSDTGHLRR